MSSNPITLLEAFLFYEGSPVTFKVLASVLNISVDEARAQGKTLQSALTERSAGIRCVIKDDEIALVTAPEAGEMLEAYAKKEREKPLSAAALETLAIILYNQEGVTKPDIDYVRGVNSQFILRALMTRGLIEKKDNPEDKRSALYIPTVDMLGHLGITSLQELPRLEDFQSELKTILATQLEDESA